MNHQFQGSRSPAQSGNTPFYNPQKDAFNPNNPVLYQTPHPNLPFHPKSNSNSFISRSNILDPPKTSSNTSAYLKNPNELQPPKFPNPVVSPTSNFPNPNYSNFQPPFQPKAANS